ncbi:MAG: hypothetical protein ACO1OR_11705, partial [Hydrogenophaga sp.]
VEEMAAAASSLRTQASDLVQAVAVFRLSSNAVGFSAITPVAPAAHAPAVSAAPARAALPKPVVRATPKAAAPAAIPRSQPAVTEAAGEWESF